MSHAPANVAPHAHPSPSADDQADFAREELHQFENDDFEAGSNIGKMLSMFFVYTVIAMSMSAYVTYHWVSGQSAAPAAAHAHH